MKRRGFLGALASAAGAGELQAAAPAGRAERQSGAFLWGPAHRVVSGRNGVVASAESLASLAGIQALIKGGNAIDAVVTASAVLNVTEPAMSGIGGSGGFMIIHLSRENKTAALDGIGVTPAAAAIGKFTTQTAITGYLAPIIPATLAAWEAALSRYGTISLGDALEPAVELAERGFPLTPFRARQIAGSRGRLGAFPSTARVFYPDGKPMEAGCISKQPDLARSLRLIQRSGPDIFYRGELAERIVSFLHRNGGLFSMEDMARLQVRWREPIRSTFQGHALFGVPPTAGGMTVFETLNILDGFDLRSMDLYGTEFLHLWLEAQKLALLSSDRYNTGRAVEIPVDRLISKAQAAEQRARIDRQRAGPFPGPPMQPAHTTSLSAADRWGNLVAYTHTLGDGWGSGVVAGDTGILLNNGHRSFSLRRGDVNELAGSQRQKSSMSPTLVFRENRPVAALGAAGGMTIPQTVSQVIIKLLVGGMDIQEAIASSRITINRGLGNPPVASEAQISIDPAPFGFPEKVRAELEALGHKFYAGGNLGQVQGVTADPETGALAGGAEPRLDGHAIAW